jgi:large subunit ribosomal protein L41
MYVVSGILQAFSKGRRLVPRKGWKTLDSKRAPHGLSKGKGVKSVGRHTKYGGYKILAHKIPKFVVPDLTDFSLRPYIARDFKPFYKVKK